MAVYDFSGSFFFVGFCMVLFFTFIPLYVCLFGNVSYDIYELFLFLWMDEWIVRTDE